MMISTTLPLCQLSLHTTPVPLQIIITSALAAIVIQLAELDLSITMMIVNCWETDSVLNKILLLEISMICPSNCLA